MQQPVVLIVEDEPLIRLALAGTLEDHGFLVLEAGHVLEAIGVIGLHRIDALVTDVDMPGALNGFDLAAMVAASGSAGTILVTSGGCRRPEGPLPQGVRFLPKPYDADRIARLLAAELHPQVKAMAG